jgi:hypothetical protein
LSDDIEFIDTALKERRSLETVLAGLVAKTQSLTEPPIGADDPNYRSRDRPASERAGHSQLD